VDYKGTRNSADAMREMTDGKANSDSVKGCVAVRCARDARSSNYETASLIAIICKLARAAIKPSLARSLLSDAIRSQIPQPSVQDRAKRIMNRCTTDFSPRRDSAGFLHKIPCINEGRLLGLQLKIARR
jgi:hypothetical protein